MAKQHKMCSPEMALFIIRNPAGYDVHTINTAHELVVDAYEKLLESHNQLVLDHRLLKSTLRTLSE